LRHWNKPVGHGLFTGLGTALGVGTLVLCGAKDAGAQAATADAGKRPAYLVLMHHPVDGEPIATPRMKHFALPDPKLRAHFDKLGFDCGVAPYAPGLTLDFLKQFNVVVVPHPYLPGYSAALDGVAAANKQLLLEYVKQGGGMLFMRVTGWQFGKDIDAINDWLKPCDVEILSEQVVDEEQMVTLESRYKLSWTGNVTPHPVTEGVRGIFYTTYYHMYSDSTSPLRVGKDWTVLLRGMKTAKSLKTIKGGKPPPPVPGAYESEPPLLAVRDYGKGRIAVWPLNATCVWQDGYHTLWGRGLTMEGKRANMHGDAARLLCNLMTHLAEPTRGAFGGYVPPKEKVKVEVGFERIDWDNKQLTGPYMPHCFVGLIGAKSSLSSGQGAPGEFVSAAREAGYDFIAFTEDLDKLTAEEFEQLKQLCAQHSTETFKAYPGFAFLDESGNSWVTFSDRLRWPEKGWWSQAHPGRIKVNNPLSRGCQWPPVILIKANSNPEHPSCQGNFKVISLYTYENGKLVDDSLDVYLRLQKMSYQLAPAAVHVVTSPDQVKRARATGFQTYVRWFDHSMVEAMSGHIGRFEGRPVFTRSCFVSEGPLLEDGRIINFATSDLALPDNDRIRICIQASSPAGLKELLVLNSDAPEPWRRFLPGGERQFRTMFDHFHDQQYRFVLQATDVNGKKAIGWTFWTAVQENSFPRCSDNINTMPRGKWWGQPKHMQNVRGIENYLAVRNFRYYGLPGFGGLAESTRPAVEFYPQLACRFGTIVDCNISRHYPVTIDGNPDRTDRAELAVANQAMSGKVRHTMFTPWQDGTLVELVEGEFTFEKGFALKRATVASFHGREGADCVSATLKDGTLLAGRITPKAKAYSGELTENGFVALFHQPFRGSVGFIPLQDGLRFLAFDGGRGYGNLRGYLADENRQVKAGETISYRYLGVNSRLDPGPDNRFMTEICNSLGLHGPPAYQVTPEVGAVLSTHFILKLKAERYGFRGRVSQAKLPLHLPVTIAGLHPRWHAGIWYEGRNRFVVAEWIVNEMNQRYTERRQRVVKDEIRHFPVLADGAGFLQIDTDIGDKQVYIGNLLVCDNMDVWLTLVETRPDRAAFTVHNPTDQPVTCAVRPGPGFALFDDFRRTVTVPAGATVETRIARK